MDLPEDWEKKALIVVGVVFILTIIYALNPYVGTPDNNDTVQQTTTTTIIPFPKTDNTNDTTNSTNSSFKITLEEAKEIASKSNPSYTVGTPMQGSIEVNGTGYNVWIVPLSQQDVVSKTIYIDANTGIIVMET